MRAVIGLLCSILVVFLNPVESMFNVFTKNRQKYEEIPKATPKTYPKLSAYSYFVPSDKTEQVQPLYPCLARVGIMEQNNIQYVIGYIGKVGTVKDASPIRPFAQGGLQTADGWGRIKIRYDGEHSHKYAEIPAGALPGVFYQRYPKEHTRTFEIVHEHALEPIEPINPVRATNPNVAGHASSSQTWTSTSQAGLHQRSPPRYESQYGNWGQH